LLIVFSNFPLAIQRNLKHGLPRAIHLLFLLPFILEFFLQAVAVNLTLANYQKRKMSLSGVFRETISQWEVIITYMLGFLGWMIVCNIPAFFVSALILLANGPGKEQIRYSWLTYLPPLLFIFASAYVQAR